MKKILFVLFFAFEAMMVGAQTQAIKVGPLGFLLGYYNGRYEKKLNDRASFQIGANYYNYDLFDLGTTGFGLDASYRHYFKEAIRGGYVSPTIGFDANSTGVSSLDDTKASFATFNIGATVGYQWAKMDGFLVDLGLGYGYNIVASKDVSLTNDGYGGGSPLFTFAIGYAF
jgi:hypothetical protein